MIPALDAETSVLGVAIARWSFDATTSALNAETWALDVEVSVLDVETSAFNAVRDAGAWRGVFGDISDCGVGITQQICNTVTNHGDMGTFSKPGCP